MTTPDDSFDQIMSKEFAMNPVENIDPAPYGTPYQAPKTGLTKRGKAALGIGAAVIAGGTLIGYQVHSSNVDEAQAKAQEIALQSQALDLEKLKEMNRASEQDRKVTDSQEKVRQASIDTCVKAHSDEIGKTYSSVSARDVIDDCQAQYGDTAGTGDTAPAASETNASSTSGGGVNEGFLIGGAALVGIVGIAVRKGTRSNQS